ncbi:MAG: ribonuclease HI family protein [Anaerolineae bacterium]|nr:ribonuclease HI family protein [Anaerolineae bacterium]MDW8068886.1 ribonuclease HI family protein [Anaerolineae bacterium]
MFPDRLGQLSQQRPANAGQTNPTPPPVIQILFDGGSRGNPGPGYGSYYLRFPDGRGETVRLDFGRQMTSNEAEYHTLLAALEDLAERLQSKGQDLSAFTLEVGGDSALVIAQVRGNWKARNPRMRALRDQVWEWLGRFGGYRLTRVPREVVFRYLGH